MTRPRIYGAGGQLGQGRSRSNVGPPPGPPKLATLIDNFQRATLTPTPFELQGYTDADAAHGQLSIVAGNLKMAGPTSGVAGRAFLASDTVYDFTDSSIHLRLWDDPAIGPPPDGDSFNITLFNADRTDSIVLGYERVAGESRLNMTVSDDYDTDIAYAIENDPVPYQRWLRIRESGGTTYFDHSPDLTTWINAGSAATPDWASEVLVEIEMNFTGLVSEFYYVLVDGINVLPVAPGPPLTTLVDNFNRATVAGGPWPEFGGDTENAVTVVANKLALGSEWAEIDSWVGTTNGQLAPATDTYYTLWGSHISLWVDASDDLLGVAEEGQFDFVVRTWDPSLYGGHRLKMYVYGGDLYCGSGNSDIYSVTYSPTDHAWWRIRQHTDGTIYFETSPNGTAWTVLATIANTEAAVASYFVNGAPVGVYMECSAWSDPIPEGPYVYVDNVNVAP